MKLIPLFDKVVVKEIAEETNQNGIFLLANTQDKQEIAEVVAVGEGGIVEGKQVQMLVKVGDKVLYTKHAGSPFTIEGDKVIIIKQSDILAIVQ